jgi:DnaD/phage-associated family protein
MTERFFDSEFWYAPEVERLSVEGIVLLLYARNNSHVNQAGFYQITRSTLIHETHLDEARLDAALAELYPEVIYYPDDCLLWERSFLKLNDRSPKFRIAAGKCLRSIPPHLAAEYVRYNAEKYKIQIPYENPYSLTLPDPPDPDSPSGVTSDNGSASKSANATDSKETRRAGKKKITDPALTEIFQLYEQNIGVLTPLIEERLVNIRNKYQPDWFRAAVSRALKHSARNLAYIEAILENWAADGYQSPEKEKETGGNASKNGKKPRRKSRKVEGLKVE